jgi:hypothetical protein
MNRRDSRPTALLSELEKEYRSRLKKGRTMSRRRLLGSISGNTVVAAVGIGGLLELLASREAIAAGTQITIDGVTREPDEAEETPHRHLFTVTFQVFSVSPTAIMGSVSGRAGHVISTGTAKEDEHFHVISASSVSLEQLILSGPEDNQAGAHKHPISIE